MIIKNSNIFMTRGDTEKMTFFLEDDFGAPINFSTGDTLTLTVKRKATDLDADKLFQKKTTTFPSGKAEITIAPLDTKTIEFGIYWYDVEHKKANGDIKTLLGPAWFEIGGEITHGN